MLGRGEPLPHAVGGAGKSPSTSAGVARGAFPAMVRVDRIFSPCRFCEAWGVCLAVFGGFRDGRSEAKHSEHTRPAGHHGGYFGSKRIALALSVLELLHNCGQRPSVALTQISDSETRVKKL